MPDPYPQLPNFFVLGAMRTGTASLAHYLDQHPAICFTVPRDPNFYRKDELYERGIDYYIHAFSQEMNGQPCRGEASPSYFAHPHVVGPRLQAQYKDYPLKFIVLLRDPVSRAWSHYLSRVHQGYEPRDFATASTAAGALKCATHGPATASVAACAIAFTGLIEPCHP